MVTLKNSRCINKYEMRQESILVELQDCEDDAEKIRAGDLEKQVDLWKLFTHNAESIDVLKENAEFFFEEIQVMKTDITTGKKVTTDHKRRITELEDKMDDESMIGQH